MSKKGPTQIQGGSDGINFKGYHGEYHECKHYYPDVNGNQEAYIYRCSTDLECCGRECCDPANEAFPIWLIIIIFLLALLFLLFCIGYFLWRWWKNRPKKPPPPVIIPAKPLPPPVPPKPKLKPLKVSSASQTDLPRLILEPPKPKPAPRPRTPTPPPPPVEDMNIQTEPPFDPDPMDIIDLPTPRPTFVKHHDTSEITREQMPLLSRAEMPEEKKARIIYYRPGVDEVASY